EAKQVIASPPHTKLFHDPISKWNMQTVASASAYQLAKPPIETTKHISISANQHISKSTHLFQKLNTFAQNLKAVCSTSTEELSSYSYAGFCTLMAWPNPIKLLPATL